MPNEDPEAIAKATPFSVGYHDILSDLVDDFDYVLSGGSSAPRLDACRRNAELARKALGQHYFKYRCQKADDSRNATAKRIYEAMRFDRHDSTPEWQDGGNSLVQSEARSCADDIIGSNGIPLLYAGENAYPIPRRVLQDMVQALHTGACSAAQLAADAGTGSYSAEVLSRHYKGIAAKANELVQEVCFQCRIDDPAAEAP